MLRKRISRAVLGVCLSLACIPAVYFNVINAQEGGTPVEIQIGDGKLKIEPCAPDIIRVRYVPSGDFREKTDNTYLDPEWKPNFSGYTTKEDDEAITITTSRISVVVTKSDGKITYYDLNGEVIVSEENRASSTVNVGDGLPWFSVSQEFSSAPDEALYGFGNINDTMGIKGQDITIRQGNVEKRSPMFYSNMGYGILFDITSNGMLTWSNNNSTYRYTGNAADSMDYYFFYGPDADTVISGYRTVTGKAALLPKNTYGYVHSRNRYGSAQELLNSVAGFRESGIPLDVIVIDWRWWKGVDDLTLFNNLLHWSSSWSDPAGMMETLHENNVSASISIWSIFGFNPNSETFNYIEANKPDFFIRQPSGFLRGYTYDASSASNRSFYWDIVNEGVFSKGLDSLWIDANEPEGSMWTDDATGTLIAFGNTRPLAAAYPLLTNKAVYGGQRAIEGNSKRVNTLSRSSVAGVQRYGMQSWSGDIQSNWASYRSEVAGVVNFSATGVPFFSTDTGGYFPLDISTQSNKELFLRWLQFSTFGSIMRTHGEGTDRVPWNFGAEYEQYITDYIKLRQRMMPYIYSLAGRTYHDDYTMVRPLSFDFREDLDAAHIKDQYMLGSAMMVAPVTEQGARERDVYLPEGKWVDFWTGMTTVSAGESFNVNAPLTQIPVFVRAGSVIPMGPHQQYATEKSDPTELRVYIGSDGSFTLYEDEGNNYNYEKGAFSKIPLSWNESSKTLTIGKREGSFDGMLQNRTFNIVFVQKGYGTGLELSPEYQVSVTYDGGEQKVAYNPVWIAPRTALLPQELRMDTPAPAPLPNMPRRSMVGEWIDTLPGEGRLINDTSGYNNHGEFTQNNGSGVMAGRIPGTQAASFRGNSYIDMNDNPTLKMTDGITGSIWLKHEPSGYANIFNKGGNGSNNPGFSFILHSDKNRPQIEMQTDRNADGMTKKVELTSSVPLPSNEWVHLAFTWQSPSSGGDGYIRIYMNGELITQQNQQAYFEGPLGINDSNLRLGCTDDNEINTYPNYYRGLMTEAKLFNYGLSGEDIKALYEDTFTMGVLPNVKNVKAAPGDGKMVVTWDSPGDLSAVDHILVDVEELGGGSSKSFTVPAGDNELIAGELKNGIWYNIAVTCVLNDGSESPGVSIVGMADANPAEFDCVYILEDEAFGWVVNRSYEMLSGSLKIETLNNSGNIVNTSEIPDFSVEPLGMKSFTLTGIGSFEEGQSVKLAFGDFADYRVEREFYVSDLDEFIKRDLMNMADIGVEANKLSEQQYQTYLKAMFEIREVLNTKGVTQEVVSDAIAKLSASISVDSVESTENTDSTDSVGNADGDINGHSGNENIINAEDAGNIENKNDSILPFVAGGAAAIAVIGFAIYILRRKKK